MAMLTMDGDERWDGMVALIIDGDGM